MLKAASRCPRVVPSHNDHRFKKKTKKVKTCCLCLGTQRKSTFTCNFHKLKGCDSRMGSKSDTEMAQSLAVAQLKTKELKTSRRDLKHFLRHLSSLVGEEVPLLHQSNGLLRFDVIAAGFPKERLSSGIAMRALKKLKSGLLKGNENSHETRSLPMDKNPQIKYTEERINEKPEGLLDTTRVNAQIRADVVGLLALIRRIGEMIASGARVFSARSVNHTRLMMTIRPTSYINKTLQSMDGWLASQIAYLLADAYNEATANKAMGAVSRRRTTSDSSESGESDNEDGQDSEEEATFDEDDDSVEDEQQGFSDESSIEIISTSDDSDEEHILVAN